ncbi:MAG: metalloregulator ArsR/SmtB family transcription factor [Nanoarchaeota archaeon]|nr:metalloregulator ArsR/SmtB family transcription factor [Nanoarchaeota archaeon]
MKYYSYNNFFMNFANKTKLNIILALENGPLSVNEITESIKGEQSKISHSLGKLLQCHILNVKQKGKQRIYSLNSETVVPILKIVKKHVKKNCLICKIKK